ncbi:MAG: imidazoleglycerol-phosphate dehydratase HisB [Planctomycetia bacterium]|jgi:imidazoleglycerol-phosphate dehydratase|nr:imidazoleglycerol-phosphate dehydratase HisB [Planctomycetia bacterium]
MARTATVTRNTAETKISLSLVLDGAGKADIQTGLGFFDHMLTLLAGHALFDLTVRCAGDLHVDGHHSVEDVGRAFGTALKECLGDRRGIRRYGHSIIPMDEALATVAVDLGGRAACIFAVDFPVPTIGTFDAQLVEVFWESVAATAGANFHAVLHHGRNGHHIAEAVFKAAARALRVAVEPDPRQPGIPSTKGTLTQQ